MSAVCETCGGAGGIDLACEDGEYDGLECWDCDGTGQVVAA